MNEHATNIFNVPIWGYVLTNEKYQAEDYLDRVLELYAQEPSVSKSNSGGAWQSRDDLHEDPIFREFVKNILLKSIASNVLKDYGITEFKLQSMWANVNRSS